MSYRQKIMLAIMSLVFCTTSVFANTLYTKNIPMYKPESWELNQNTWHYVGWPYQDVNVEFYVSALVTDTDGKVYPADTVTLDCGGVISKVIANTHTTCKLKASDNDEVNFMGFTISPEDFSHGSRGWLVAKKDRG